MMALVDALAGLYLPKAREGQGLVEYSLILVLVALVSILTLALVGGTVNDVYYSRIAHSLATGGL